MAVEATKAETIRNWFKENPSRMTIKASRYFEVSECDVLEVLKPDWPITEIRPDAYSEVMEALKDAKLLRVNVRNGISVLEADCNLKNAKFSTTGHLYNIDCGNVDMHVQPKQLTKAYALQKRSHKNPENITYSFQFFGADGDVAIKVFLWHDFPRIPSEDIDLFNKIVEDTRLDKVAVEA